MALAPSIGSLARRLGAGGTVISCAVTMVVMPLSLAGVSASAAIHAGSMAGMGGGPGTAPDADGTLAVAAQGLLVLSLPLAVLGLWGFGWPARGLSAGSGAALYASMYVAPSLPLFALAGGGLAAAYGWAWKKSSFSSRGPPGSA